MFSNVRHSSSFDGIDDRNERPLIAIVLATIVVVWSIVGLIYASGSTGAHSARSFGAATAITSPLDK